MHVHGSEIVCINLSVLLSSFQWSEYQQMLPPFTHPHPLVVINFISLISQSKSSTALFCSRAVVISDINFFKRGRKKGFMNEATLSQQSRASMAESPSSLVQCLIIFLNDIFYLNILRSFFIKFLFDEVLALY